MAISLLLYSCSFNDIEIDIDRASINPADLQTDSSIRHINDNDLIIRGDSVILAFERERALEEGVSLQEYDLVEHSLQILNSKDDVKLSATHTQEVDPNWNRSIIASGVLFSHASDTDNPCSDPIALPNNYNIRNAVSVECSFASHTNDYALYFHTLIVRCGDVVYGMIDGNDNAFCREDYYPISFPISLEYYCPINTDGYTACTWRVYGFNDDSSDGS